MITAKVAKTAVEQERALKQARREAATAHGLKPLMARIVNDAGEVLAIIPMKPTVTGKTSRYGWFGSGQAPVLGLGTVQLNVQGYVIGEDGIAQE